jgi:hypothetical protein
MTTALHLLTSYLTTNARVRQITLASGLVGLTLAPYTLIFMEHINKEIVALDARDELEDKDVDSAETKHSMQLIAKWSFRHRIREGIFGLVWALGVWAAMS